MWSISTPSSHWIVKRSSARPAETGAIVVAEEHLVDSGLGVRVAQIVAETNPCLMEFVGIHDTYAESGSPEALLEKYGLTSTKITEASGVFISASANMIRRRPVLSWRLRSDDDGVPALSAADDRVRRSMHAMSNRTAYRAFFMTKSGRCSARSDCYWMF